MLFKYENKVYIKPFGNKLIRVSVSKKGDEYDVKPTQEELIITPKVNSDLYSISLEEAYKMTNKASFKGE